MARTGVKLRKPTTQANNQNQTTNQTSSSSGNGIGITINQVLNNAQQAQDDGTLDNVIPQSIDALKNMTDGELAQVVRDSKNIDMPYHLNDIDNDTQKFVFAIGLNDKPTVLQGQAFDDYLRDNNIPRNRIMSRSINGGNVNVNGTSFSQTAQQVAQQLLYGKYNYIGGKRGGNLYGNGTYFDMNGGGGTGYGSGATVEAVLSPNAKVVSWANLWNKARTFVNTHPQTKRALGGLTNENIANVALMLGYNVISDGYSYYNVIDRSAIIARG